MIRESEDSLFKSWKNTLTPNLKFIPDGIIDEISWIDSPCKILFLLKEANDSRAKYKTDEEYLKNKWDLREYVNQGTIQKRKTGEIDEKKSKATWGNISVWAYGIKEIIKTEKFPEWDIAKKRNNHEGRLKHLKSTCIVNIKKQPGSATTNEEELKKYFSDFNKKFLSKQLKLYSDSDIIICCGSLVTELFVTMIEDIYGYPYKSGQGKVSNNTWIYKIKNGPLLISFYHPQQRNLKSEKVYNTLMNVVLDNYIK